MEIPTALLVNAIIAGLLLGGFYAAVSVAVSLVLSPLFFLLGMALYRIYYLCFEKRGQESLRGLAFFFGILFITEVALVLVFGVQLLLTRTFFGRAVLAVAQDQLALRLMGVNPIRVKELAFGLSIATAGVVGAFLIVIQPVQPAIGREFIGLAFAVCVLGGMGSIWGTLLGAFVLGIAESFTSTFFGPSWAPAVSFGLLLATLAFKPSGLLGR